MKNKKIRLTKVSTSENPVLPTPESSCYKVGEDNGEVSVPLEYCIEGILQTNIQFGKSVVILKTKRNGEHSTGIFCTSAVAGFSEKQIITLNSIYKFEFLDSEECCGNCDCSH